MHISSKCDIIKYVYITHFGDTDGVTLLRLGCRRPCKSMLIKVGPLILHTKESSIEP